jgi:hypothetical protein
MHEKSRNTREPIENRDKVKPGIRLWRSAHYKLCYEEAWEIKSISVVLRRMRAAGAEENEMKILGISNHKYVQRDEKKRHRVREKKR